MFINNMRRVTFESDIVLLLFANSRKFAVHAFGKMWFISEEQPPPVEITRGMQYEELCSDLKNGKSGSGNVLLYSIQ